MVAQRLQRSLDVVERRVGLHLAERRHLRAARLQALDQRARRDPCRAGSDRRPPAGARCRCARRARRGRRTLRRRSAGPGAGAARWWRRPPWRLLSGRIRDPSTLTGPAVACRPCPPRTHRSTVTTAPRCAAARTRRSYRERAPTPTTSTRPGALHAHFVRSEVAHGRILSIDTEAAAAAPGVVGVFTARRPRPRRRSRRGRWRADDMLRPTLATRPRALPAARRSRSSWPRAARAAVDAAELVEVDYRAARHPRRSRARARRRRAAAVRRQGLEPRLPGRHRRRGRARGRRRASCAAATSTSASPPCRWSRRRPWPCPTRRPAACIIWAPLQAPAHRRATSSPARSASSRTPLRVISPNVGGGFGARIAGLSRAGRGGRGGAAAGQAGALRREPLGDDDRDAARPRAGPGRRARRAQRRDHWSASAST